jgi:hypothetical protein
MKRQVLRATQSSLNAQRWALDLDCGHTEWINSRAKPTRKTLDCPQCKEKEIE